MSLTTTGKTYSFQDVTATIIGPGLSAQLADEAGAAEEGISIEPEGQKDTLTVGADGSWMHSLRAANPGTVTIRLLKTSNVNNTLSVAYNAQRVSSIGWGKNTIMIKQHASGDVITCMGAAFENPPQIEYATVGNIMVWKFLVGRIIPILGEYP